MTSSSPKSASDYTIGAVARLTGLSTQLIRAWEQRYGAVVARRAANGRRIYSTADVEKLGLLKVLTERGIAISTIANLDVGALRARVEEADKVALKPLDGKVRVAALGAFVPDLLRRDVIDSNPVDLVAWGADPERFLADTRQLQPDVLVIETDNLSPDSLEWLTQLRENSGAGETIVAYGFSRSEEERTLASKGFRLIRTPLMADELAVAVLAAAVKLRAGDHYQPPAEAADPAKQREAAAPPRRFSQSDLARLAAIESAVDCECPKHLAVVVQTLSAFESYSAHCEDQNEQDAALHTYLHRSTAQARALMEEALAHLAEAEGIKL